MSAKQERSATLPKAKPEGFRAGRLRLRERSEWEHGPADRVIGGGAE